METAYRTHLAAAAGYYQHLVFRLQREFSLRLAGVIDYHLIPEPRTGKVEIYVHGSVIVNWGVPSNYQVSIYTSTKKITK